MFPVYAGEAS